MSEKIKVLMVDDEAAFRETTSKILTKKGFDTTVAAAGEDALAHIRKDPRSVDVVVLDIKMPGMDGHQALKEIKSVCPDAQVIMLTGHGGVESAKESLSKGAYDYLNKPCDIDLLASKIRDAYKAGRENIDPHAEKKAGDIMIPIENYTTIRGEQTVKEAIAQLLKSFEGLIASRQVMETGHRSVVVYDKNQETSGILSIQELIAAVQPAYLSAPKPSMADSMQYSPMFWSGQFTTQALSLAKINVEEIMAESPPSVDEDANLMELAHLMNSRGIRRLLVKKQGKVSGVVREQELFFEISHILLKG